MDSSWRSFFSEQTLAEDESGSQTVLFLFTRGLPERGQFSDPGLLERLVFALLSHEGVDIVVQSLYLATGQECPVEILDTNVLNQICQSGFIALARCQPGLGNCTAKDRSELILSMIRENGFSLLILPKPLLTEQVSTVSANPWPGNLRHTARVWLSGFPKCRLWLRRWLQTYRLRASRNRHGCVKAVIDPGLAHRRRWVSSVPVFPEVDVNICCDERIPVWVAVHWLELGGAEKFALDLVRALPRQRYRIHVTTDVPSRNSWSGLLRDHVEEIWHLPEFLANAMDSAFSAHFITTRKIKLLHIHHAPRIYASLFEIRRRCPEVRILDTLHILELPPNTGGYPEYVLREFAPHINHHHVISQHLKDFCTQRWLVPGHAVSVVYLNVDSSHFCPENVLHGTVRGLYHIPASAIVVGFVGRLTQQKQPSEFVKMAERLSEKWKMANRSEELHFIMAGSGESRQYLEAAIRKAGLNTFIHLHGEVIDTRPVYADCDLMVLPSENEGLALVCYESMSMGKPVVCTDVGAQRELVPRELLVTPGSGLDERLTDLVWRLAVNHELRIRVGSKCRDHVMKYHNQVLTWQAMESIYTFLLTGQSLELDSVLALPPGDGWSLEEPELAYHPKQCKLAAAIVSYNHRDSLCRLLDFLDRKSIPVFVTENASSDGTMDIIRERYPHTVILESSVNLGGTGGFNCAVLAALNVEPEYILLIDDDALPREDCIERLLQFMDNNTDYVFSAPAIYITGTRSILQETGGTVDFSRMQAVQAMNRFRTSPVLPESLDIDYASACCLMVRADDVKVVGVMDWNYFIFSDDVDWCLRLRQVTGKRGACVTGAAADHDFPWSKPFSPVRLYFLVRNGIYLASRFARGGSRPSALVIALIRPLRRLLYSCMTGDIEIAKTVYRALRDALTSRYGAWHDPVTFPSGLSRLEGERLKHPGGAARVLLDLTIHKNHEEIRQMITALVPENILIDIACDPCDVLACLNSGHYQRVLRRTPGFLGPIMDWWIVGRVGYDLIVTDATLEPRRPAGMTARYTALFHAGQLYEARKGFSGLLAYLISYPAAAVAGVLLSPFVLRVPVPGKPCQEAAKLLDTLGYDGAVGQPWARLDTTV